MKPQAYVQKLFFPVLFLSAVFLTVIQAQTYTDINPKELLARGVQDGQADVEIVDSAMHIQLKPGAQFTIWYPEKIEGEFQLSFESMTIEQNTKILLLFYAMPNNGSSINAWKNPDADYDGYANGMQVYTLGVNRGAHSAKGTFSLWNPDGRSDLANLRRLGTFAHTDDYKEQMRRERKEMGVKKMWKTPAWQKWNANSTIVSAYEPGAEAQKWVQHDLRCKPPYITYYANGKFVFEVVDKTTPPLSEGYIGLRNMSRGKEFRIRNIRIAR